MSPLGLVIAIVLVDLLGFSIVMPLLAPFAREYQFSPIQIGWLLAAYPLAQLVAAPILGRLSDRFGRRPVLAASQFGTALSFLILGLSHNFTVMLLARLLDGASGGNILVAQAYVADVTKPEERSRGYGLIGMAFGLGFVLGPLLGLALVELPVPPEWRLRVPFLVAAGFSTLAWVLVLLRLPESLPRDVRDRQAARVVSRRGLVEALTTPGVGRMIALGALTILAFAALEGTLSLYLGERQGWSPGGVLGGFAYLGLITALVQGGLVRRLVPRLGEPRLIVDGLEPAGPRLRRPGSGGGRRRSWLALTLVGVGQGLADADDLRPPLADHARHRARRDLRDLLRGADAGADDQLPRRQLPVRPRDHRRPVLGGRRDRPPCPRPGRRRPARRPETGPGYARPGTHGSPGPG